MSTLRFVILVTIVLKTAWFILPQFEYTWMSEDAIVILSYAGLESMLDIGQVGSWLYFIVTVILLIYFFIVGQRARHIILAYFLVSLLVLVPFGGMIVETGASMTLRDLGNLTLGASISISFLADSSRELGNSTVV